MAGYAFELNGAQLEALPSGALWWPERRILCVSDLHLGKAERIARRGGTLLPPYDTAETLIRLRQVVEETQPREVICLGDSFDDLEAERDLGDGARAALATMAAGRRWVWIAGNHDPGPVELGGSWVAEYVVRPLVFRHIAEEGSAPGEVSGHYHPKANVPGHRARPCLLVDARRAILPAFGAYTGGLRSNDPALRRLFDRPLALLTGRKIIPAPC